MVEDSNEKQKSIAYKIEKLNELVLDRSSLDMLEWEQNKPNIFTIMDVKNAEIKHSRFLAWLLNPKASHGFGDQFLRYFMITVLYRCYLGRKPLSLEDADKMDLSDVTVRCEYKNMDILVDFGEDNHLVMVIENKIRAKQRKGQLPDYKKVIEQDEQFKDKDKILIFLTATDEKPEDLEWAAADYRLIREILTERLNLESLNDEIRHYIDDYIWLLDNVIISDKLGEMCNEIYQTHRVAIDAIIEHRYDERNILRESVFDYLKSYEKEKKLIFLYSTNAYIRFTTETIHSTEGNDQGDGTWLRGSNDLMAFEINLPAIREKYKAYISLIIGPGDKETRTRLYEASKRESDLFSSKDLTNSWTFIYSSENFEIKGDLETAIKTYESRIDEFMTGALPDIEQFFKNYKMRSNL